MLSKFRIGERLPELVDRIVASYESDERTRHLDRPSLPSGARIIEIIQLLIELAYPDYYGRQGLNRYNVKFHVGELLPRIGEQLHEQVYRALCYQAEVEGKAVDVDAHDVVAREITMRFLEAAPAVRELIAGDVQAAYDGDPAAVNTDEVILAYPGVLAITVYRFAHELCLMKVPLIPRMMTEWAHSKTGTDIHPGATIGRNFFIDHATGVVVGETTEIGDNVKLYQGVTLGAMSFPKDERGRLIRGYKRHPTVKDNVTVYANATVLGGNTILGEGSIIGASTFLTNSVPPFSYAKGKDAELKVRQYAPHNGHDEETGGEAQK